MSIARNEGAGWQRNSVRSMAVVLPVLAIAALAASKWPMIDSSVGRLGSADGTWMAVAGFAACMTWVCSSLALQGAVIEPLPPGRLLATQFASAAANHVLPAGIGGNAVNLRFLIRRGLTPTRAVTALAVRATLGVIGRFVLLFTVLLLFPHALHLSRLVPHRLALPAHPVLISAALITAFAGAVLLSSRYAGRARTRLRSFAVSIRHDVRALHHDRARIAALWVGALAFPSAHTAVVVAVSRAVHASVPVSGVVVAYLFASTAAGWMPTPAGIGSLDAALALTLVTAGASGVAAASAVLGYRLVTAWLPLLPGVLVLAILVRRRQL